MRENIVRAKLRRGQAVFGTMVTEFNSPAIPILLADAGLDFFILDMEHGVYSLADALRILQTARLASIMPFVRVPDAQYHLIASVLDAGALGILVPRVETRAALERAIAAMRYPPLGVRGVYGGKANNDYVPVTLLEYTRAANEQILSIAQIESKTAVERIDELLSTPGLDAALVGPWDMALSMGVDPSDPSVAEMARHVAEGAKRCGITSGIHIGDAAQIKTWRARGMTLLMCAGDLEMFRHSAFTLNRAMRE